MERRLFDSFNELFEANLSNENSREESFEKAKEQFTTSFGWSGFKNYESFKSSRSNRMKRNRQSRV